jgi:sugar phosphate isomerase/epimerase
MSTDSRNSPLATRDSQSLRSRLCVHTMTTKPWSLAQCVDEYQRAGISAITVWRQVLDAAGIAALKASSLRVTSLCRGGFFPAVDAAGRQKALDDNRRAIDEAASIGAPLVVLVCGAVPGMPLTEARQQIADGIAAVLPHAKAAGVKLSIEPLHPQYAADRSAVNTMAQARRICEQVNRPGGTDVGIAVDAYHVWWDDAFADEIRLAGQRGWIHAFHVCDWKAQQADVLNDRGLMGEGCIDLRGLRAQVEAAGFTGDIEVEIFSTRWWATDQREWLQRIIDAYQTHV